RLYPFAARRHSATSSQFSRTCSLYFGNIPEVIDHAESKGWDLDFYMTSVYNLGRTREEGRRLAGKEIQGEYFRDADRELMLQKVRRASKQCLIFKVYGASRHCASREQMLAALRLAFRFAKRSDCVVLGMFPKYKEQVRENCELVAECLRAANG
ncbi:MAG: hypothetical protein M1541_13455, partial [Acidobacteria bacterium]|nr:hypothetical protein [Acidobacteriota bacterium]